MLIATDPSDARVDADAAVRGVAYRCPGCDDPVTLRRGAIKTPHFAHHPRSACGYASGESATHMTAKVMFLRAFRRQGLRAEAEFLVPHLDGDRRADVLVWDPSGQRVAIEVQHSNIGLPDLYRRSESYARSNIAVIWVPVLDKKLLNLARATDHDDGDFLIRRYPTPHWPRWMHGYAYGRLSIMTSDFQLWGARFRPCRVTYPGGRERILSECKDIYLTGPHDLSDIRLELGRRSYREYGDHRYPAGPTAYLVAQPPHLTKAQRFPVRGGAASLSHA